MDTISRENNSNYLPIAGVLVGIIALAFACIAFVKANAASKELAADTEKIANIDTIGSTADSASRAAQKAQADIASLQSQAQDLLSQHATAITAIQESIKKLEEAATKPAPKAAKASKSAVAPEGSAPGTVSSDGTYTVKSGDSLAKIARANGVSLADLEAANPGVDPKRLKVGQKISLPTKSP